MDVQGVHRPVVAVPDQLEVHGLARHVRQDGDQVGVGDRRPEQELDRERVVAGLVPLLDGGEAHDDVGVAPLRPDERLGLGLTLVEVGQHLRLGVAAVAGVTADLPPPADLLGRVEVDLDVEAGLRQPGVERQQPLDDHELPGLDQLGPVEGAVGVAVDGLQDGLAHGKKLEVLLHDLHVVAVRVQRRERDVLPLDPVVAVVVVDADGGHPVGAKGLGQALGEGRLPRCAVAGDGQHDGPAAVAVPERS